MPGEIDLVVFDLDGVLARLDRGRRLTLLAEMTGKDPGFLDAAVWASDFERRAEAGAYPSGGEYLAEFNRRIGATLRRDEWVRARRDAMTVDREVLRIAEALRDHCAIAMLTNNGALLHETLAEILPAVHRVFGERAHASFQFNARKPERAVFERLLSRYGVAPSQAAFIDDYEEFVDGARQVGMHGIRFTGAVALRAELERLGLGQSSNDEVEQRP